MLGKLDYQSGLLPKSDLQSGVLPKLDLQLGESVSGRMLLNMISKNVRIIANSNPDIGIIANSDWEIGIIANSNREYRKPNFPILGNQVSNWDSSGVLPKLGFQSGPIKSDGISLKKLTRKSAKMPNPKFCGVSLTVPSHYSSCLNA